MLIGLQPGQALAQEFQSEVHYSAVDSMRYDLKGQTVYLFGSAKVRYEDMELTAERIVLDLKNEKVCAFSALDSSGAPAGHPEFKQGDHTVKADTLCYNFTTRKGLIKEVRSQEGELFALAHTSKMHANHEVHSKGGVLTTCDRPRPHYHFAVSKMMVIPDDKIVVGPAVMKVGRVPTPLALPFGFFPNHKGGTAGILIPVWGNNDQLGYYLLNGGYYIPFSDRFDAQLTGDIYSRGSWALKGLARYKSRYRYGGNLKLSHSSLRTSIPEYPDFSEQKNYELIWNHIVDPKASLTDRFSASVNVITSQAYTSNFNSSLGDYLSNTFQSQVRWSHAWLGKPYNVSASLLHSQNTLNRTFSLTLPSLVFNVQRISLVEAFSKTPPRSSALPVYFTWSSNFDNRLSTTEDQLSFDNLGALTKRMRNGLKHTAAVSTSLKNRFVTLNPQLNLTDRMYFDALRQAYDPEANDALRDTVPGFNNAFDWNASANLTSKLYGTFNFRGKKLKAIRHVITPNVGFTYTPGNDTRESGPYGIDQANITYSPFDIGIYGAPSPFASGAVSMGLNQSLEAKVLDNAGSEADPEGVTKYKKMQLLDFVGINTSYDLLRDSMRWSAVSMAARTRLLNKLDVTASSSWDPYATTVEGIRYDRPTRDLDGSLFHLTNANLALGFEVKSKRYGQAPSATKPPVVEDVDPNKGADVNFQIPWQLRVSYSYNVTRQWFATEHMDSQSQSMVFNGDLTLFKWWKLGLSSGYDFEAGEKTPTSVNLYWDMHCWEFNLNVIPLGLRQSFSFRINVKASVLRDLKYEYRKPISSDGRLLF